jgi:hypothetical protein
MANSTWNGGWAVLADTEKFVWSDQSVKVLSALCGVGLVICFAYSQMTSAGVSIPSPCPIVEGH